MNGHINNLCIILIVGGNLIESVKKTKKDFVLLNIKRLYIIK